MEEEKTVKQDPENREQETEDIAKAGAASEEHGGAAAGAEAESAEAVHSQEAESADSEASKGEGSSDRGEEDASAGAGQQAAGQPEQDEEAGKEPSAGDQEKGASAKGGFWKKDKKDKKDEKIDELNDQLTRLMAEFENFRRRTDREKSQMFQMGSKAVIEKILPVVDNFERGLQSAGEDSTDPFVEGMRRTYRQLTAALEGLGVKPIEAVGKPFDPQYHNAVMHCEDESVGENMVVQELQKGYMLNDTVIRHSMVKVAN